MTTQRYPKDLALSAQDFAESGWKEAIAQAPHKGYREMRLALSKAARDAIEQGRHKHGKALWLLADACSMRLVSSSRNEPFKPSVVSHNCSSAIPDSLTDADITFFKQIIDAVDDHWLRARLADLIWLWDKKHKPHNNSFSLKATDFALMAIDAYRSIPLDMENLIHDGQDCWMRAINLAQKLKGAAGEQLAQMEDLIIAAFNGATRKDALFGLRLANLLKSNGLARTRSANLAKKLETLAHEFDDEGDLHFAQKYFFAAAGWYKIVPDAAKAAEMTMLYAEDLVKEAVARVSLDNPSYGAAAFFYEKAIQIYRTIPRAERATYRVDERIKELRIHLNNSGERSRKEMRSTQIFVDISQCVEDARKSVSGKSVQEALLAFANPHYWANAKNLCKKNVLERIRQSPLQFLSSAIERSRDGRVVAKRPAMSMRAKLTEDDKKAFCAEMVRSYSTQVSLVAQGFILPALGTLRLEHCLREADFVDLAEQSPIVPENRAGLFGKALFAGYECDFVTALHLLVPQIEHMVRERLKQAGAKTTNIDKDGIENENGLSTLMDLPEVRQVFGRDMAFELKSLFCDPFGPNLRNELAHGLLDENACQSRFAIYAWWLALRLVFNT